MENNNTIFAKLGTLRVDSEVATNPDALCAQISSYVDNYSLSVNPAYSNNEYVQPSYSLSAFNIVKLKATFTNEIGETEFFVLQPKNDAL